MSHSSTSHDHLDVGAICCKTDAFQHFLDNVWAYKGLQPSHRPRHGQELYVGERSQGAPYAMGVHWVISYLSPTPCNKTGEVATSSTITLEVLTRVEETGQTRVRALAVRVMHD